MWGCGEKWAGTSSCTLHSLTHHPSQKSPLPTTSFSFFITTSFPWSPPLLHILSSIFLIHPPPKRLRSTSHIFTSSLLTSLPLSHLSFHTHFSINSHLPPTSPFDTQLCAPPLFIPFPRSPHPLPPPTSPYRPPLSHFSFLLPAHLSLSLHYLRLPSPTNYLTHPSLSQHIPLFSPPSSLAPPPIRSDGRVMETLTKLSIFEHPDGPIWSPVSGSPWANQWLPIEVPESRSVWSLEPEVPTCPKKISGTVMKIINEFA